MSDKKLDKLMEVFEENDGGSAVDIELSGKTSEEIKKGLQDSFNEKYPDKATYSAYVCQTDWDYHFPDDWSGVDIYFSEKSIREHRKCVEECGIVKIKVSFDEVVQEAIPFERRKMYNSDGELIEDE